MSTPDRTWYRPMTGRHRDEPHRASTPLELLFDLCFVVAVAEAGTSLHRALAGPGVVHAVLSYASVFFAIWWAWVNFTWFASAYDTDDVPYRLATLVQISGALVIASGVPRAFDHGDFRAVTLGYVVMRVALVGQWLRAAHGDAGRRRTALRFAIGVTLVQVLWVARLALPATWVWPSFAALALADMTVPVVAEWGQATPYHREHIAERYGLFTLIVLGESVLAATVAIQTALDSGHGIGRQLGLAGSGLTTLFALWWLYFDRSAGELLTTRRAAFAWGYGHYLVFSSAAAIGAGLTADAAGQLSTRDGGLAVGIPVAVYLVAVWLLQVCPQQRGLAATAYPVAAGLVLLAALTPVPLPLIALVTAALVAVTSPVVRPAKLPVGPG